MDIYDSTGKMLRSYGVNYKGRYSIGTFAAGNYYISIYTYGMDETEKATLQLSKQKELTALAYTGADVVFQYGEWGYSVGEGPSGNYVNTRPVRPYSVLSSNTYLSLPMELTGTLEDGNSIDIWVNGRDWHSYKCGYTLYNADGSTVYADVNGYLADGNYILRITAFGGVSVDVPVQVVGGPIELTQLTYTGEVQSFAYGTWGYSTKQLVSGNQLDDPRAANSDMNKVLSGNNYIAIDFTLNGKGENGEETEISYRSKEWNLYGMKNYFYDAEGNSILTDADGYIPVGTYTLKCVAKNGVTCEVPFEVYLDEELITEKELENAVEDILEAGEALSDESLQNASDAEKQAVVEQVLEKVDEISSSQDIAEIGAASAEDAIEFTSKLTVLEEQIEDLLGTSVEVVPQDTEAEDMELEVKNALLSVPAGENAEIKVTTVEVPNGAPVDKQAIAVKVQLIAENDAKLQLQVPVIITMKLPEGINKEKEIVVYHYSDNSGLVETIPVVLNGDGTVSFAIGSFSTLVLANASVAVTSVTLDKTAVSLNTQESTTLTATVAPSDASNKEVLWKSDNTAVATVDSTGKVTAVAAGTATITATAVGGSDIFATCKVTVTEPVVVDKVEAFVTRMYQQCLSRDPDKAGLDGWVSQLKGGYMNGAQIAEQFVFSNEMLSKNLSNKEFVKVLYRAMMGREADEAGLAGWVEQLDKKYMTRSQVTKSFVESKEFTNICTNYGITRGTYNASTAPIEQFVTRFYTLCLEREPDQVGLYGWVGNLKNKYMNGAQIADSFFFSKEFVNKNVSDEKYIELLYNTLMGRASDESGKAGWMRQLANGWMTRKDMMKSFIESKEFTGICETYGINRGSL